jgi:hypothetical protein
MSSTLAARISGGRGCARWRGSGINVNWSRLVDMRDLLCLVAWENLFLEIDRLQLFPRHTRDLQQRADVDPWTLFVTQIASTLHRHPDGNCETLARFRHQVVRWRRSWTTLTDPKSPPNQRMERIEDRRVLSTGILLTGSTVYHHNTAALL